MNKKNKQNDFQMMDSFFEMMFNIDIKTCKSVSLQGILKLEHKTLTVLDFLKDTAHIVTIDNYSNKEIIKKTIQETSINISIPPDTEDKYVMFLKKWYIIGKKNDYIGYATDTFVHNPFPTKLDLNEIVTDPSNAYSKVLNEIIRTQAFHLFKIPAKDILQRDAYVIPSFYSKYYQFPILKKWFSRN